MSTEENLSLLEKLDRQGASLRRRAAWVAWGSVTAAALVMALLIAVAYQHLSDVRTQVDVETKKLADLKIEKAALEKDLLAARQQRDNYQNIVQNVPKDAAIAAAQQATSKSSPAALLPRIYLHIVDDADREYAKRQGKLLEENGFVVLGVEYVKNITLKNTQVRFYTNSQQPVAERILDILKKHGDANAVTNNLRLEDVAKTRPNQFEVWFRSRAAREAREPLPSAPSKSKS
jgi:hypothetical protein